MLMNRRDADADAVERRTPHGHRRQSDVNYDVSLSGQRSGVRDELCFYCEYCNMEIACT